MWNWDRAYRRLCNLRSFLSAFARGMPPSESADDLSAFVETYHRAVVELLDRIYANPNPDESSRFLILDRVDAPNYYVQCALDKDDHEVLCEAASGYFAPPNTGPWFTPEQKQALAGLGFAMDEPQANFRRIVRFESEPDCDAIADLLLTALHVGYDVRMDTVIGVTAPFAMPRGILARDRCIPIS